MRPLLFLVADKNMEYALRGFFERDRWDLSVPCERFDFDTNSDIRVATGHDDPGLYARANKLLRPFSGDHSSPRSASPSSKLTAHSSFQP